MSSAPQLTASLAEAIDFMNVPVTAAGGGGAGASLSLAESLMALPAVTGTGMASNTVMRRVSVENLLAAPLNHHDAYPANFDDDDRYMTFKTEDDEPQYDPANDQMEDDDIEEITRSNDFNDPDPCTVILAPSLPSASQAYYLFKNQLSIPRKLDPLPQWLFRGDNMKYFHHYLKFTARLLVPHDCSENPFKHILPQSPLFPILYYAMLSS